jgi:hypothetical protein
MRKNTTVLFIFIIIVFVFLAKNIKILSFESISTTNDCGIYGCIDDYLDFEGFDNVNGVNKSIVPNIVHLIYLNETNINFYQMICIFSIYFNHKPELIYFYCDDCSFHGKYWEQIKSNKGL